jgi:rubrerythrin
MPDHTTQTPIDLAQFDRDGALQETGAALDGATRASFLRRAGVAAAGLVAGGAVISGLPSVAAGAVPKSDVAILNFALTLEYLESAFYKAASANFRKGKLGRLTGLLSVDEAAHVKALKSALGSAAVAEPKFNFGETIAKQNLYITTAFTLENTGVHAYLGQAGNIKTPKILAAAASILTIEARHAAAIALVGNPGSAIINKGVTPDGPFDKPLTKSQILSAVKKTGFIVG